MNDPPGSPRDGNKVRPWVGTVSLVFVVFTLIMLVVGPLLVQSRVDSLRVPLHVAEPARTLVHRLQFNLSREMSLLNEMLLSGDTAFSAPFAAARASEDSIFAELVGLMDELGPEVRDHFVEARTLASQWHEAVRQEEILAARMEGASPVQIARERRLFEDILVATGEMDEAILRMTAHMRSRIAATERMGLQISILLGVLALLAAGAAAHLHSRVRQLAIEAEHRRALAEEALADTARANESRVRLLRGVTHDVKNPLGAARGYAELLEMGVKAPMTPGQEPLIRGVRRSIDSALAIISDLLDVARADSGGLVIRRVEADLRTVAAEVVEDRRAAAEATGLTLTHHPGSEPVAVHTDPARVRQILDNLLSNAIKYTPAHGRITVSTELSRDDDRAPRPGAWAVVRVTDTGPGIDADRREAIFEEFTRLNDGSGREGHGLGLAIGRSLARLLGGDITLEESGPGGSTFVLWLPRRDDQVAA